MTGLWLKHMGHKYDASLRQVSGFFFLPTTQVNIMQYGHRYCATLLPHVFPPSSWLLVMKVKLQLLLTCQSPRGEGAAGIKISS